MPKLLDFIATAANVARPGGQQTDVALVLADRMPTSAIGLELSRKSIERFLDAHDASLEWVLGMTRPRLTGVSVQESHAIEEV